MQLYLVQHGASKSEAEDPQRGLTDAGRQTVERVAEQLVPLGLLVDRIEHSDELRARQTAEILTAKLRPANGTVQASGLAPNDDVEPTLLRLTEETRDLMVVGHLPHLNRLVSRLFGLERDQTLVRFHMGGVVKLDRDDAGRWALCWILTPELLLR